MFSQTGCSILGLTRRTVREPGCHSCPKEKRALEEYRCWGIEAWQSANGGIGAGPFYDGFLAGFVDHVISGGVGEPPVVPPCQFWNRTNENSTASLDEWIAGFRRGAESGEQGGYRDRVVSPVFEGPGRPQRAIVSEQSLPQESECSDCSEESPFPSWDSATLESQIIDGLEAPETVYEPTPADPIPANSIPAAPMPESLQVPQDAIRWSESIDETVELSPKPVSNGDDPAFAPNDLNQPPESPDAEEVLDSLLPDAPTPRNPDEPVDLDDLFSNGPDQPIRTESKQVPKHSARDQKVGQSYRPWSYGDMIKASQSEQTSSLPPVVTSRGKTAGYTDWPKNAAVSVSDDEASAPTKSRLIQFAQEFESDDRTRPVTRPTNATKSNSSRMGKSRNLSPDWRISDWQQDFGVGDYGPGSDEEQGVSINAWESVYGTKK